MRSAKYCPYSKENNKTMTLSTRKKAIYKK